MAVVAKRRNGDPDRLAEIRTDSASGAAHHPLHSSAVSGVVIYLADRGGLGYESPPRPVAVSL